MNETAAKRKWGFCPPQRYITACMVSFAVLNGYAMRVCLSMAITEMIAHENATTSDNGCPVEEGTSINTVHNSEELFDWDEHQQGLILGAFYWGYIISHLPGGLLAERYGAKHVLGAGMLLNAAMTLLTPLVLIHTRNISLMILLRVLEGLGQGPLYPAMGVLLNHWVPPRERASLTSLSLAGATFGIIAGNLLTGYLITTVRSWTLVFYVFGALGLLWNVLWQVLCSSTPATHPSISSAEREYLRAALESQVSTTPQVVPWGRILKSGPVWALVVGQVGHDWGWYTLVTDLPKYLKSALKLNVQENGWASSVPYGVLWLATILTGFLADFLVNKRYLSVTVQRKLFTVLGTTVPGVFMVAAAYVGCDKAAAVLLFALSVSTMCFWSSGLKVNILDVAPNFSGTIVALVNGLGVISGMLVPYIIGILAPEQTISQWKVVFWISFWVLNGAIAVYVYFGTSEVQEWNQSQPEERTLADTQL